MKDGQLTKTVVLLVGDVMVDVIVKPEGALRVGSDRKAKIALSPGGSAANQAVWLAANHVSSRLVARVGRADIEGLTKQFIGKGVTPNFIADNERSTGVLVSMVSEGGERSFFTDRGANEALCIEDLSENLLDDVGMILLSGYSFFVAEPRAVALALMARAAEQQIPVLIDPSSAGFIKDVGVENFLSWTTGAAILFPNAEEAALLSGRAGRLEQLETLGQFYGQVVLTEGELGASAISASGDLVHVQAIDSDVVDTTGAGDAFVGGFVSAKISQKSLQECLQSGAKQGAIAVAKIGAQPS